VSYTLAAVKSALDSTKIPYRAIVSPSHSLDILPLRASKALAIEHVAGDSGNDQAMRSASFLSIVVANREESLEDLNGWYWAEAPSAGTIIEALAWWGIP